MGRLELLREDELADAVRKTRRSAKPESLVRAGGPPPAPTGPHSAASRPEQRRRTGLRSRTGHGVRRETGRAARTRDGVPAGPRSGAAPCPAAQPAAVCVLAPRQPGSALLARASRSPPRGRDRPRARWRTKSDIERRSRRSGPREAPDLRRRTTHPASPAEDIARCIEGQCPVIVRRPSLRPGTETA
jgi:hypothetical protein